MKAELLNVSGNDNTIANVARVSYDKDSSNYTEKGNARLIDFLAREKHTSPFRHTMIQFRLEMPIYVERQIFKHQVGVSANSISGRYVDFSDTYYEIDTFRTQSKDSKQGSGEDLGHISNMIAVDIQKKAIERAKDDYNKLVELGVSKEQARTILPLNLNTKCIMTFNLLSFAHLCHLRLKDDAQKETRDLVRQMLILLQSKDEFKYSLESLGLNNL